MPLSGEKRQAVVDILKSSGILENAESKTKDELGVEKLSADELGTKIKDGLLGPFKNAAKSFYDETTQAIDALKRKRRALANVKHRSKKTRPDISSHGGNDAGPGAIVSPIDPHYNSYANSPVIEYQQLNGYPARLNGDFAAAQASRYHGAYFALEQEC